METITIDTGEIELSEYGSPGRPTWADVDWTLYRRSAIVEDRKINYVDLGDPAALPVVFIHGLAGCWQNWLENLLPFATSYRVIAPDLPGFGQSEMPAEPISIPGYARIVHTLLGQLGVTRAAVVGNSMGGMISFQLAMDYPELVKVLVPVSPAGLATTLKNVDPIIPVARGIETVMKDGLRRRKFLVRRPGLRRVALLAVAAHPEKLRPELCYELMSGAGKPGFVSALHAIAGHDYSARLKEIQAPTTLVWGRADRLITSYDAVRYEKALPDARRIVIRDTGHLAMLERPAWFNQSVPDIIDGSPA
jgi:pimeloyl-ACP methyl ester carboxylesterase